MIRKHEKPFLSLSKSPTIVLSISSSRTEPNQIELNQIEILIDLNRSKSNQLESNRLDSNRVESNRIKSSRNSYNCISARFSFINGRLPLMFKISLKHININPLSSWISLDYYTGLDSTHSLQPSIMVGRGHIYNVHLFVDFVSVMMVALICDDRIQAPSPMRRRCHQNSKHSSHASHSHT